MDIKMLRLYAPEQNQHSNDRNLHTGMNIEAD